MYNKKIVFSAACLGMLIFGIVMTTLGTILPSLIDQYGISKINAGSLMSLMSIGIMIGSVVFGPVVDRYGYKMMLVLCTLAIFIGLEGIAYVGSFELIRIFIFLIGFGGGVINGGTNALVADISTEGKSANLSLLGVFFGIGAMGIPFLMGSLIQSLSYGSVISGVGLLVVVILIFFMSIQFPGPKQKQGFPIREGFKLFKEGALILFGFILFFESGMEITIGSWATTFMKEDLQISTDKAVLFLSFYWMGMMLARLLMSMLLRKISPAKVLISCLSIALIGSVVVLLSNGMALVIPGLFLIGVGFAAGFPVILGYVGELYANLSGTAFSIALVMALTGGTILPLLTGILGEQLGLRMSLLIVPFSLIAMFILFLVVKKRAKILL